MICMYIKACRICMYDMYVCTFCLYGRHLRLYAGMRVYAMICCVIYVMCGECT